MAKKTKHIKTRFKIVAATVTAVFSLASVFTATLAWFSSNTQANTTGMQVSVKTMGGADLATLNLIKFDYQIETIGNLEVYDYLHPARGTVNEYYYNEDYNDGEGAFGYDDNGEFIAINDTMNVYDPVDRIIRGGNLASLNCNAIYEVKFTSAMSNALMRLTAQRMTDKNPGNNQILLSECVDFDVYCDSDLEMSSDTYSSSSTYAVGDFVTHDSTIYVCKTAIGSGEEFNSSKWDEVPFFSASSNYPVGSYVIYSGSIYQNNSIVNAESFSKAKWVAIETYSSSATYAVGDSVIHNGHPYRCITAINSGESFNARKWEAIICEKIYYPSYKTTTLSESEEKYYILSYLSSLEATHSNFYSSNPRPDSISIVNNELVEFDPVNNETSIYINVNYAPSQADVYIKEIYNTIRAIYDFYFEFGFSKTGVGD